MYKNPPYNDKWERTKRYLFRNLLENPGFCLSPIPEDTRSESSDDSRPYSPLPDLIIEREPNRHDDSEEFYQGLERRMKKYYKRLFIDGVDLEDDEVLVDNDEDSSEIEVNRSMASTLIIDKNNRQCPESNVTAEILDEPDSFNISEDKTEEDSKSIESDCRSDSINEDILIETDDDDDVSRDITELSEEVSKSVDTEPDSTQEHLIMTTTNAQVHVISDVRNVNRNSTERNEEVSKTNGSDTGSTQTHHRISTTIAQIHEEVKRKEPVTRVFEDGSPVLLPRFYRFSKTIFENVSDIGNTVRSEKSNVLDDKEHDEIDEINLSDNAIEIPSQNEAKESNQLETNITDSNLEVEFILGSTEKMPSNTTPDSRKSFEDQVTDDNEQEECHDIDDEELTNYNDNEEMNEANKNLVLNLESEEEQLDKEESIGPDEFNYTELETNDIFSDEKKIVDANKDSFEMALRRGMFETKNKRKTTALITDTTDEEINRKQNDSEEFEPIEVMRTNTQAELEEVMRRQSTMSQEDPFIAATATQPSAEKMDEDLSDDDNEIDAATEEMKQHTQSGECAVVSSPMHLSRTPARPHDVLLKESAASQDSSGFRRAESQQCAEYYGFPDDLFIDDNASIQKKKKNIEELHDDLTLTAVRDSKDFQNNKRGSDVAIDAPLSKKKKNKDAAIQTNPTKQPNKSWESTKANFFVGSPLIFKLCGCSDHFCS